jgi:hypothetical protein
MRREKTQISKIRNTKGEITTNTMKIQEIIRDFFESLYANKFENLEEMDRFLETYNHPKLNQEDINYLKISITHKKKLKLPSKASQNRKVQDLMDSLLNSIRHLKKNQYQLSLNYSMK